MRQRELLSFPIIFVGFLLSLWGVLSAVITFFFFIGLGMIFYYILAVWALLLLQGVLCALSGFMTLVSRRPYLVHRFLYGAALCFLGLIATVMLGPPDQIGKAEFSVIFAGVALLLGLIAYWFSRQDDEF